jgi:hypothetical protein
MNSLRKKNQNRIGVGLINDECKFMARLSQFGLSSLRRSFHLFVRGSNWCAGKHFHALRAFAQELAIKISGRN